MSGFPSLLPTSAADDAAERQSLMGTMDLLNAKYGHGTLKQSRDGLRRWWEMKADRKSQAYTTSWDEIALLMSPSTRKVRPAGKTLQQAHSPEGPVV
ncbi:DUF4113 domain-containing protein [Undibacterium arcticum]